MKNRQQGFIGIVLIILVAGVVGGGVYYKKKINPDFLKNKVQVQATSTVKTQVEKKDHVDTDTSVGIQAPTIPATSVSLSSNAKVSSPITVPVEASVGVKTCTDAKCFTDAIDACSPSKFTQPLSAELLGSQMDVNYTYETKPGEKSCDIKLTVNSYKIAPSAGLLKSSGGVFQALDGKTVRMEDYYKELNLKSQITIGKSMICEMTDAKSKKIFSEIILNKEGAIFMLGDQACKGELITIPEKIAREMNI